MTVASMLITDSSTLMARWDLALYMSVADGLLRPATRQANLAHCGSLL